MKNCQKKNCQKKSVRKVKFDVVRYVVTFVEYGDSVDGKARVLGVYPTEAEAQYAMAQDAERYKDDLGLDFLKVYIGSASVGDTDECGCEYCIEIVSVPIYEGEDTGKKKNTIVFPPFKTLKVTCDVDWDLDDEDSPYREPKGYVPDKVYTVTLTAQELMSDKVMCVDGETGEYVIDGDALADSYNLSDTITDDAGFCHKGYRILEMTPDAK